MSLFNELKDTFGQIATSATADETIELLADEGQSFTVAHHQGALDKYGVASTRSACVRVRVRGHVGISATEDLGAEGLLAAYRAAAANARLLAESVGTTDIDYALPASSQARPLDREPARLESLEPSAKIELSRELEACARAADTRVKAVLYGGYAESQSTRYLFNSAGLAVSQDYGECQLTAYPLVEEGGVSKMAYPDPLIARDPRTFDAAAYARATVAESLARLNPRAPASGRYDCVFSPRALRELLERFGSMISGQSMFEKTSPFSDKLGSTIASPKVFIVDDPWLARSRHPRAYDDEGSPTQRTALVEGGVFTAALTDRYWAAKTGYAHTANSRRSANGDSNTDVTNLVLVPGMRSQADLLRTAPRMLFVNELNGMAGFSRTTGRFSIPACGSFVENGALTGPADEFVISSDLIAFLSSIVDVGSDLEVGHGAINVPSVLVSNLSVAGK